jgi:hypothetical protein
LSVHVGYVLVFAVTAHAVTADAVIGVAPVVFEAVDRKSLSDVTGIDDAAHESSATGTRFKHSYSLLHAIKT